MLEQTYIGIALLYIGPMGTRATSKRDLAHSRAGCKPPHRRILETKSRSDIREHRSVLGVPWRKVNEAWHTVKWTPYYTGGSCKT